MSQEGKLRALIEAEMLAALSTLDKPEKGPLKITMEWTFQLLEYQNLAKLSFEIEAHF